MNEYEDSNEVTEELGELCHRVNTCYEEIEDYCDEHNIECYD